MNFSYKWLQSFFAKPLPSPSVLAEILQEHSFEVEKIQETKDTSERDWQ
ncbi:hypothetical protein H5T58_01850, partial [Candidatus Parcubacteria bacterium]|nr:hypothetical protein [Candidatus Parcubacteria bacterium]